MTNIYSVTLSKGSNQDLKMLGSCVVSKTFLCVKVSLSLNGFCLWCNIVGFSVVTVGSSPPPSTYLLSLFLLLFYSFSSYAFSSSSFSQSTSCCIHLAQIVPMPPLHHHHHHHHHTHTHTRSKKKKMCLCGTDGQRRSFPFLQDSGCPDGRHVPGRRWGG